MPMVLIGVIRRIGVALIITFKKQWSPYLAPAFGLLARLICWCHFRDV